MKKSHLIGDEMKKKKEYKVKPILKKKVIIR